LSEAGKPNVKARTISAKPDGVGAASQRLIPAGRTIWIADAHRDDGKRFVARANEKLTAFIELESAIWQRVNDWESIADDLKKAGWTSGCISSTDRNGRQFWVVAAEREDAVRFILQADGVLTAFMELQAATYRQLELG